MPQWVTEWLPVAPWLVAIIIVIVGIVKLWPYGQKLMRFIDDVAGEPERPGFQSRPGLMERVARIEHEVRTNHGTSLKDAVKRIEVGQEEHRTFTRERFESVGERLDELGDADSALRRDFEMTRNTWEEPK